MGKKKNKKGINLIRLDITLLILFPIIAVIISLSLHTNFLISNLLFLGLPSLYLSLRTPTAVKRALLFTLPFSIFGGIAIEKLAEVNKAWFVSTIFPYKLFGNITFEALMWGFLITYTIVIFYEHFLDKGNHATVGNRLKYLTYFLLAVSLITITIGSINISLLQFPYTYLIMGMIFLLLPASAFVFSYPKFISKFAKTAPYFFYLAFLDEITGLQLGHWNYPGTSFIGWFSILGQRFPYEELFYFWVIFSTSVLCYFEFFDDNRLKIFKLPAK